jgi:hypothetical protein
VLTFDEEDSETEMRFDVPQIGVLDIDCSLRLLFQLKWGF